MYDLVYKVAPSIFLFAQPSQFERDLQESFKNNFSSAFLNRSHTQTVPKNIETKITGYTEDADDIILASFLSIYNSMAYPDAYKRISDMASDDKEKIYKDLFKHIEFFDAPPREFELVDITFQAMISASGFAQLKRHRMATLLAGDYDIDLGNTIPESIESVGLEHEFIKIIKKTNECYVGLKERYNEAADYILTNSHRRMVIHKMNLREMYHFIRLRDDEHAQWEIRKLAGEILLQVKKRLPYSTMLLCGKDSFTRLFEKIYSRATSPA
jgi:thymidylate synthase ThyX